MAQPAAPDGSASPGAARSGTPAPAVSLRGIVKRYPRVAANDGVDLRVAPGSIHAVVGENGAGKSTLMKILYGMVRPDEGAIEVAGRPVSFSSPREAIALGIGMVHQHFMLVGPMTVYENVVLGAEPFPRSAAARFLGAWDRAAARAETRRLSKEYGISVSADAVVRSLSVGEQQRVEILKVLYRGAKILILDEPTAVLTPQEADALFAVLRRLRDSGATVIFISHKLKEVLKLCDAVTVLRRGKTVGSWPAAQVTQGELARRMIGELEEGAPAPAAFAGPAEEVLRLENVCAAGRVAARALHGISLTVRSGEIVGIAGVEGNGQRELAELAAGLIPPASGSVRRRGRAAYIPEDRHHYGLLLPAEAWENMLLGRHRESAFSRPWRLLRGPIEAHCRAIVSDFDLRPPELSQPASAFSGGNQQKIVVGRELSKRPELLVAAHPTRGVDLAASKLIHRKMLEAKARGAGVLLISSDLDELLSLSDRMAVIFAGRITGECPRSEATVERLGLWMAGVAA